MYVCQRIGHGGASALAPANTLASFDAALDVGVDMVEFDVRAWRGELVLAHTILDAPRVRNLRLHDALAHLAGRRFADVGVNLDVKSPGFEPALLDELRRWGLLERALVSSQMTSVIDRVRALEPGVRVGVSIGGRLPRLTHRWGDWRAKVLAGLTTRRWDAVMAQHRIVNAPLLADVVSRDGLLYAWTVNDRVALAELRALGVHGIATADPRLFA